MFKHCHLNIYLSICGCMIDQACRIYKFTAGKTTMEVTNLLTGKSFESLKMNMFCKLEHEHKFSTLEHEHKFCKLKHEHKFCKLDREHKFCNLEHKHKFSKLEPGQKFCKLEHDHMF